MSELRDFQRAGGIRRYERRLQMQSLHQSDGISPPVDASRKIDDEDRRDGRGAERLTRNDEKLRSVEDGEQFEIIVESEKRLRLKNPVEEKRGDEERKEEK